MRPLDLERIQSASNETARDINRRIILNLVRIRREVSRADLARMTGLQRSTVSLIAEELIGEQWLIEGARERLPRGRHPKNLRLNERRSILGVDLRPSVITIAASNLDGHLRSQRTIPTPADPATAIDNIANEIRDLMSDGGKATFEGIGLSLPGRASLTTEELVFTPNLRWPAFDLKSPLEERTGLSVQMENAANLCVLAEVWFGKWERICDMAVVTISEGVGSGIYANGQLVRGDGGMAGEFGHVTLDPEGPLCSCGRRGCWEVFASNNAALRYYETETGQRLGSFSELMDQAHRGNEPAARALRTMARYLARGMGMIVGGLAPEVIIVVGELTHAWDYFAPLLEAETAKQSLSGRPPRIVPGGEGASTRLRGTVALVLQRQFGVPLTY